MEEQSYWQQVLLKLPLLHEIRKKNEVVVGKMNMVHETIPQTQDVKMTFKAAEKIIELYKNAIDKADKEMRAISEIQEKLSVLMALKEGSDTDSKRKKRKTGDFKDLQLKEKKKIKVSDDLVDILQPGDYVVVRPANQIWILALVLNYMAEKNKYLVEDAEDDELNPGTRKTYVFPPKHILPIPKNVHQLPEYPPGHVVLALYPNTSCFYRAIVSVTPSKNKDTDFPGSYIVTFEDDGNVPRYISPNMVLDYPKERKK